MDDHSNRQRCLCGSRYFVKLEVVEVLLEEESHGAFPGEPSFVKSSASMYIPVAECMQCRLRYDRRWRVVA